MSAWVYDSDKQGLRTVFFDYEIEALQIIWAKKGEFATSREVWAEVSKKMTISRASIINSLNRMVERGVLEFDEVTCKGGHRGLYAAKRGEAELRKKISEELKESISKNLS